MQWFERREGEPKYRRPQLRICAVRPLFVENWRRCIPIRMPTRPHVGDDDDDHHGYDDPAKRRRRKGEDDRSLWMIRDDGSRVVVVVDDAIVRFPKRPFRFPNDPLLPGPRPRN